MKFGMRWILPLLLVLFGSGACLAQSTNSGDIRGSVTDASGALIPAVKVTVQNVDTGVTKDFFTNNDGVFDTSSVVAGSYKLTFTKQGFDKLVRGPVTIEVGNTTVNAQLKIGTTNTEITVTEDVPQMHTEAGDQTSTLESHDMAQLPNVGGSNGPDWQNFMILLPGATGAAGATTNAEASNPGQEVSTNGNLPFSNVLADGATTTLPSSANANPAAMEDVEELQVSLSSFSAQYGIGGLVINQITKGGAARFHGSVYDYLQNATPGGFSLNAANFGFLGAKQTIPFLRYDDYGGTVSGPVALLGLRKKAFFFFGYDQIKNAAVSQGNQTVPTAAFLAGNFGALAGSNNIYDPTTTVLGKDSQGTVYPVIRTQFLNNTIPLIRQDKVSQAYQSTVYSNGVTPAVPYGQYVAGTPQNGLLTNNWFSSYPLPRPWKRYFGRLDFDITPNNRLTMSDTQGDEIESNAGPIAPCPIACQLGDVDNNNAQVTDVWNISGRTINEARFGYTDQLNFFTDAATASGLDSKIGWKFPAEGLQTLPIMDLPSFGNQWFGMTPGVNAQYKEFVFDPSDVVTMIRGKHILHFGGEFAMYRDDTTPWGNISTGEMNWTGQYTQNWTLSNSNCPKSVTNPLTTCAAANSASGQPYADFLLGYAQSWKASVTPESGWRLKKPQMFVQDDWKLHPNLTINLGFRYEISHGMNEVTGNLTSFDPTVTNPGSGTLGAQWYGSTAANGRTALQHNIFSTALPRVGFAWAEKPNTTIRGGFGIYSYNWSADAYGSGIGSAFADSGNGSDQSAGFFPYVKFDGTGTTFPLVPGSCATAGDCPTGANATLPYVTRTNPALVSPTRFNGGGTNFNDYNTPIPKIYQYSFGVERQLSTNLAATLTYVGSHGLNLTTLTDINAVTGAARSANSSSTCGVSGLQTLNCERPYPIYTNITGNLHNGISNYNSIQATITRRMTQGLTYSFNYVYSHFLDDQDSSGWGSRQGPQVWQYASTLAVNNASKNYGSSNFDVRQAFKGYIVYQLPVGKGKQYLNNNAIVDAVAGGWQVTGSLVESTGNPFSVTSGNDTWQGAGNSPSQFPNWVPGAKAKLPSPARTVNQWFNEAAFSLPAPGTFGNVGRNALVGPGINNVTLSGGKTFSLPWEGMKLMVRVDANNALNHPSFENPGGGGAVSLKTRSQVLASDGKTVLVPAQNPGDPYNTSPYASNDTTINGLTVGGRTVQLGARLSF
jgi:hypothetical protein